MDRRSSTEESDHEHPHERYNRPHEDTENPAKILSLNTIMDHRNYASLKYFTKPLSKDLSSIERRYCTVSIICALPLDTFSK